LVDCKKRAVRRAKASGIVVKKNWTCSRASYWSCGNKTKGQENPTSDEDFWRVQVHNVPVEGREEGSLAMVRRGNKKSLFLSQES
jgi:hypothetical protein